MNVKEYISSGIVESYVMGLASEAERLEFETNCVHYPEIEEARKLFELVLEERLLDDSISPPQFLKPQIEDRIKNSASETTYTETIHDETTGRRIGVWRWIAAASLILLAGSVYWALITNNKYQELEAKNLKLETEAQQSNALMNEMQEDLNKLQNHPMKTVTLKSQNASAYAIVYWDTVSTSKDVYLLINNLPQPASDKQYQLWALQNGQPIDLGLVEVKEKRLLHRMKNVQNAEAFAISLEPKGGSTVPTQPLAMSKL